MVSLARRRPKNILNFWFAICSCDKREADQDLCDSKHAINVLSQSIVVLEFMVDLGPLVLVAYGINPMGFYSLFE